MVDTFEVSPNDIAIVGMALRVPGARNVREFWSNLVDGVESIRDLTESELLDAGESLSRINSPNYVRRTSELPDMEMFDADFFGLSPKEAAVMDPQHRHFLECAWEAMEDAGRLPDSNAGPTGIFAGCGMGSYFYFNVCSNRQLVDQVGMFLLRHTGNDKDFLATRASFAFDLRGPSINVQTACSTSLVAVHMACQSLMSGECEMALAGGVTIELPHRRGYVHQEGEILSPDGHCRAFDHRAGGTVFGSGVGVVVLRRLSDAIADGDIIHGVIKGTAVNNDGASKAGYLAPSVTGQAEAIIEAHGLAGVSADTIGYVECHGTGTYLGDPIEIEALTQAFEQSTADKQFCRVGSVKSNIGHLDTAAGVVSLIKATMIVKTGQIPATLGFERPNPAINFDNSPFVVNDRLTAWPQAEGPRRAGVNSLGVGGTNAHAVVEEPPLLAQPEVQMAKEGPQLFLFSAKSSNALGDATVRMAEELERDQTLAPHDIAYTLFHGRKLFEHRRVVAAETRTRAIEILSDPNSRHAYTHTPIEGDPEAVFLFPGGGAQYVGMARNLYARDQEFRRIVDEGLSALPDAAASEIRHAWLEAERGDEAAGSAFLRPSVQLPAILILEVAVARYLMRHGVSPKALIGHSMGENAAACVAGVLSLQDAVRLVRLRGELFDTVEAGGMLSVPLSASAIAAILPSELDLASANAPELSVVSGRNEDLEFFKEALSQQDIDATRVPIDIAAHSRMLEPILEQFEAFLRSLRLRAPTIPIVSNLTGTWLTDKQAQDPSYWVSHLRSTVEFGKGISLLVQTAGRIFIEVGPGRGLSSLAKLAPGVTANQVINSLPHADDATDDYAHVIAALGRAWATGLQFPIEKMWNGTGAQRVSLPTYPFQHQRYFIERSSNSDHAQKEDEPLRKVADIADWGYRPSWRPSVASFALGSDETPRSILVFTDDTGIGASLVRDLRVKGHRVRTVRPGDTFAQLSEDDYSLCPEDGRVGYDALCSALNSEGPFPTEILHLWLVTNDEGHRAGSSFFNRNQEHGFYSLLYMAQALGDAGLAEGVQLTVVTNGMQRVGDERVPYPEKATVLGPCLTAPKEMPGLSVRAIDIQLPAAEPADMQSLFRRKPVEAPKTQSVGGQFLLEELFADHGNEVVAYRNGRRWLRTLEKLPLMPADDRQVSFKKNGVYLITGGSGDLALSIAKELSLRYQARLVLVGRSALPTKADWQLFCRTHPSDNKIRQAIEQMSALEADGGEVLYLAADVANPEEMARVVARAEQVFGPINGILHAAGVISDDLIQLKKDTDIQTVLAPKLHGTAVLDRLFKDKPLDLFVLFSSTSTDTAPAGQVDYVAANAYLNAYAESCAANTARQTVALHWGVWNGIGLAARATQVSAKAEMHLQPSISGSFFQRWAVDEDGLLWLEVEVSSETHWFLNEHRMVSGDPVIPGTGTIEIIMQTAHEYGLTTALHVEDLVFLKPLLVPQGTAMTLRVGMRAIGKNYAVEIKGRTDGAWTLYAQANLGSVEPQVKQSHFETLPSGFTQTEKAGTNGFLRSIQEKHVRFGPRWQTLRAASYSGREAQADLSLSEEFRDDDVILHPALLDIATGFAMQLVPGYVESDVLWAPVSYGSIQVQGRLPFEIKSRVRLRPDSELEEGYASFDVTITGLDNTVVFEAKRFQMKRLSSNADLITLPDRIDVKLRGHANDSVQSPALIALAAQVSQGILPQEGFDAMLRAIATRQVQPIVSSMDLHLLHDRTWAKEANASDDQQTFERPELESDFVAPRNPVEKTLAQFWSELLGVKTIGVHDSFFDVGGHSLLAVRLFRMIKKEFGVDLPISVLFEAPTIAECAALIGDRDADEAIQVDGKGPETTEKPVHLVTMSSGPNSAEVPVFLCAGMFGNILNLRQLALHLGNDRAVYGLQARGLYGDQEPHETFEEAAAAYLKEIRAVRPHGPYLLGGFSGGGLIAYEMARQLTAAGEEVPVVIMLDTPIPLTMDLSAADRLNMKWQDLQREGPRFLTNWLSNRLQWKAQQRQQKAAAAEETSAAQFHNAKIEAAFRRGLERYHVQTYDGKVVLFRPKLNIVYTLSGGRRLQDGRNPVMEDNGWTPYVADLQIQEVAGNHDSMVLEPYVRVLAHRMRSVLEAEADQSTNFKAAAE